MKLSRLSQIAQIDNHIVVSMNNLSGKSLSNAILARVLLDELKRDLLAERAHHLHEFHGGDATLQGDDDG